MITTDIGIILGKQFLGEKKVILCIFSQNHGIQRCITSFKSKETVYQKGNLVEYVTHTSDDKHFKASKISIVKSFANLLISDYKALLSIQCIAEIINSGLKENHAAKALFENVVNYLQRCLEGFSVFEYIILELDILRECGYGLNIKECGVTKSKERLSFVSPRTGRAISYEVGFHYKDKLLTLPEFILTNSEPKSINDISTAFKMTGYFLNRYLGCLKFREKLLECLIR